MKTKIKETHNIITILPTIKKEENLLPLMFFDKLKNLFTGGSIPFYLTNETAHPKIKEPKSHFMFNHLLFAQGIGKTSNLYETFEPILYFLNEKVKVNELLRMKLNLYTNQNKHITHRSHIDISDENNKPKKEVNVAIFNFTTCNGGTKIGKKTYPSNENEALIFSNELKHCGITQTDTPTRFLLNVNWK
tara:strand:+ start:478 stop:1047 length:570 start_codon:yes stop_codon:yes gene_type:complete